MESLSHFKRLEPSNAVWNPRVPRGVKNWPELAVVFVESSDQRVFQDSADLFIYIEGQVVDVRGGFSRLLCGKKFFQLAVNALPVFLVGTQSFT